MAGIPQQMPAASNKKLTVQNIGTSIRNLLMGDEKEEEELQTAPALVSVPLKTLKPQLSTVNVRVKKNNSTKNNLII